MSSTLAGESRVAAASGAVTVKPRIGFLGLGWIGFQRMVSIAKSGHAEIVALADPVEDLVAKAAEAAPGAVTLDSFDELLEVPLDGIVIATPSALHAEQTIAALERGMAVFCQKPLGRTLREVSAAIEVARRVDRLLEVDLSYRFTEALRAVRDTIRSGDIGDVFAADAVFHNAYGPQKPWFYDPRTSGGGCVMDLGIHLVDAILWILQQPVKGVQSSLFSRGQRLESRENECEDYATARLDLHDGAVVDLACSWHLHAGQDAVIKIAFYGTKGGVAMTNLNGSFLDFCADRFTGTSRMRLCQPPDEWGGRAAMEWARRLATSRRYNPEIEQLLDVARVLDAIYERAGES